MTKRLMQILAAASMAFFCTSGAVAQETHTTQPPKILVITNELVKPGKGGATHEKAENLYIQAFNRSKSNRRYIGMEAASGKTHALFFAGYDSMTAWQQTEKADQEDSALSAAMARADLADGELLESIERSVWIYDEESSQKGPVDMAQVRYFEIERFQVRPGHDEWMEIAKLLKAAYAKSMPNRHWALYDNLYGQPESSFLVIIPMKSAAEIDDLLASGAKFAEAIGEEGIKHVFELESKAVSSSEMNLFVVNPKMSRPPDSWVKADPTFWKPQDQPSAQH